MIKSDPREVASSILNRSICAVQVGSCIADSNGLLISWGWNNMGPSGMGRHAEIHAILRGNRKRMEGATIYVAAIRRRNGKVVPARPCEECQPSIELYGMRVWWRDSNGEWRQD